MLCALPFPLPLLVLSSGHILHIFPCADSRPFSWNLLGFYGHLFFRRPSECGCGVSSEPPSGNLVLKCNIIPLFPVTVIFFLSFVSSIF
jgi:hypothetical protein